MLSNITDINLTGAPLGACPGHGLTAVRDLAACGTSLSTGENRLSPAMVATVAPNGNFVGNDGSVVANGERGITATTGHQAHAAVCMHADPASGSFWRYEPKPKATPPSAGGLRTS